MEKITDKLDFIRNLKLLCFKIDDQEIKKTTHRMREKLQNM